VVSDVIANSGSYAALDMLFLSAGAPPAGFHSTKWKDWLFLAGQDPQLQDLQVSTKSISRLLAHRSLMNFCELCVRFGYHLSQGMFVDGE
jgi:hypothetical protein